MKRKWHARIHVGHGKYRTKCTIYVHADTIEQARIWVKGMFGATEIITDPVVVPRNNDVIAN